MLSCCVLQARVVSHFYSNIYSKWTGTSSRALISRHSDSHKSGKTAEEKHLQKTRINKHEKAHAFSLNLDVFVSLYPTQKNLHKFRCS